MLRKPTLLSLSKFMLSVYSHTVCEFNSKYPKRKNLALLLKIFKKFYDRFLKKIINILNFSQGKTKKKKP